MAGGGFLARFLDGEGKEIAQQHCYKICVDYDTWKYSLNNEPEKPIPDGISKIEVVPE